MTRHRQQRTIPWWTSTAGSPLADLLLWLLNNPKTHPGIMTAHGT